MNRKSSGSKPARGKKQVRSEGRPDSGESRAAEATTVAWMLTAMATIGAILLAGTVRLATRFLAADATGAGLRFLPDLLIFTSLVTGILCLCLTVVVYRVRKTPPPSSVTIAAVLIGLSPVALTVFQLFQAVR